MAKEKPAGDERPKYVALVALSYWSAGKLRRVAPGEVVDDVPETTRENWLTITPPAIREATAEEVTP